MRKLGVGEVERSSPMAEILYDGGAKCIAIVLAATAAVGVVGEPST